MRNQMHEKFDELSSSLAMSQRPRVLSASEKEARVRKNTCILIEVLEDKMLTVRSRNKILAFEWL